jgi:hypothetical protein
MGDYRLKEDQKKGRMQDMECDLAAQFRDTVFTLLCTRASQPTGFQIIILHVNQIAFNFITQLISFSQIKTNP